MPLSTRDHQTAKREHQRSRASAARANRLRVAGVRVLEATDQTGAAYTLALSDKEPDKAYVLKKGDAGAWECGCFSFRWQKHCAHTEAAAEWASHTPTELKGAA